MFNRQKNYTSPILCRFLQQNLIIEMYFYLSAITCQDKTDLINRQKILLQTKSNTFLNYSLQVLYKQLKKLNLHYFLQVIIITRVFGHNKYLIEFPSKNISVRASNFDALPQASPSFYQNLHPFVRNSQIKNDDCFLPF